MTTKQIRQLEIVEEAQNVIDYLKINTIYENKGKYEIYINGINNCFDKYALTEMIVNYYIDTKQLHKVHHSHVKEVTTQVCFMGLSL